jgi:hypothetical protein
MMEGCRETPQDFAMPKREGQQSWIAMKKRRSWWLRLSYV